MNDFKNTPVVGIIMDGNSTWANARGRGESFGHKAGAETLKRTIEAARKRGIKTLVVYAFSGDNWKRPRHEVSFLMALAERYFKEFAREAVSNDIRIRVIGDHADPRIPQRVCRAIDEIELSTLNCGGMDVFIAFNYSGMLDFEHMVQGIALDAVHQKFKPSGESFETVRQHLLSKDVPDIDVVIRTSGQKRLSDFFPVQTRYAELFFVEACWPDFDESMLDGVLVQYAQRKRRFGGRPVLVAAE